MKITTSKIDKGSTLVICIIGIVVMIGSAAFYIFASERDKITRICVYAAIFIMFVFTLFSLFLYYLYLTFVYLEQDRCTAYSFWGRQLCRVDYNEQVFYSFFNVYIPHRHPVKFMALSNSTFKCKQNTKSIFEEKFYGYYEQSKIIVFPYDTNLDPLLHLDAWHKIISE